MNLLVIVNDPPYGTERAYNAIRLAAALAKRDDTHVRVFLLGDAVGCAVTGQSLPNGYYHLERMLTAATRHGVEIGLCGTCMDARAIDETRLVAGAHRSTLEELADWTLAADRTITF